MNQNIRRLHAIAAKKSRSIIGLMSGTSLDGLDIALCSVRGSGTSTKVTLRKFVTVPYDAQIRDRILAVFAKPVIDFRVLTELNAWIALAHASMINTTLKKWKIPSSRVDVIASHGQTVFHAPKAVTPDSSINSTLQIGDGDHMAVSTGIITFSDFRQKHIAAGGEGAPLAVYGDYLLFSKSKEDRIMLNIGGIGNFTYLPGTLKANDVFVTDTGPGNTLLDQAIRSFGNGRQFDRDSRMALAGNVHPELLSSLMKNPFFDLPFPKTTGPEQFNLGYLREAQRMSGTESISQNDIMATLTRFSAETISAAIRKAAGSRRQHVFFSGGGAHNPLMIRWIKELLPGYSFSNVTELGIDGDAKEAVLFAVLANESLAGGKTSFGRRGKVPSVSMGKVSFPK